VCARVARARARVCVCVYECTSCIINLIYTRSNKLDDYKFIHTIALNNLLSNFALIYDKILYFIHTFFHNNKTNITLLWFYEFLFISKLILHNKIISCSVDPGVDPENKKHHNMYAVKIL